jgi:hypothetical protein
MIEKDPFNHRIFIKNIRIDLWINFVFLLKEIKFDTFSRLAPR